MVNTTLKDINMFNVLIRSLESGPTKTDKPLSDSALFYKTRKSSDTIIFTSVQHFIMIYRIL